MLEMIEDRLQEHDMTAFEVQQLFPTMSLKAAARRQITVGECSVAHCQVHSNLPGRTRLLDPAGKPGLDPVKMRHELEHFI